MNTYSVAEIAGYRQADYLAAARRARQAREAHRRRAIGARRSDTRVRRGPMSVRLRFA